jgi:hypothetical protein
VTKPKTKIRKGPDGWVVNRPAYGFGDATTLGPFPSWRVALDQLSVATGAAGPSVERASTPEAGNWTSTWWHGSRTWQPVIR